MIIDSQRRAILQGRITAHAVSRPPWAIAEPLFEEHCERCQLCSQSCPEQIIKRGDGGFPEIDFQSGACTFCGRCADACPSQALQTRDAVPPWRVTLRIEPHCLALKHVVCGICLEQCASGALSMRSLTAGRVRIELDSDRCNGCGACVGPCPVGAVKLITYSAYPSIPTAQPQQRTMPTEDQAL